MAKQGTPKLSSATKATIKIARTVNQLTTLESNEKLIMTRGMLNDEEAAQFQ